jgi:hypothetical protein
MFEDIFDRNWELALLIQDHYQAASCASGPTLRERSKRIEELLKNARHELPSWQEDISSAVSFSAN